MRKILLMMFVAVLAVTTILAPAEQSRVDAAKKTVYLYTKTSDVKVKETKSTKAKNIATLKKNTKVTLVSKSGQWRKVKVNKKTGWIQAKYLKGGSQHGTSHTTNNSAKTIKIKEIAKYTKTGNIVLRSTASVKGKKVTTLSKGKKVTLTHKKGAWRKVKVGKQTGWIQAKHLATTKTIKKTTNKTIKFKTTYKNDPTLKKGTTKVSRKGKNGIVKVTEKITYKNGKIVSRNVISKKTTKKPVHKIVLKGTKKTSSKSSN